MAHIQQGDNRQYFSTHEVSADMSGQYAETLNNALNSGVSITQKANESTMAHYQIDLSTKFLAKNNEINTKYQADPTNPQREVELKQAFESLANQYKINPTCVKQWSDIKTNVYDRYSGYNAQWVEKQQQTNIQLNLKNGYENLGNQISMLGLNGSSIEEMRLIRDNGIEALRNGAIAGLGEVVVNDFLKDANHDIMTTYISALALNNPLEAQKLLKDEGVRQEIGRAETLEKLDNYVTNSLTNQAKRTAVQELGNTLRSMNSEDANNIINGKADLNKVMKFIESNKNLPEGSKDLILNIYGIGSRSEYYYDKDKKKIVKQEEKSGHGRSGSGGSLVSLKKLSKTEKEGIAINLEEQIADMFFFDEQPQKVKAKKSVKKGEAKGIQGNVLSMLQRVAKVQGEVDTALNAGIIDKPKRQNLMNRFIEPMTNYLEANLQDLDEKSGFFGKKLGYAQLKETFKTDEIPKNHTKEIMKQKKMLLTAQGYYYSALDNARKKMGLESIYDLENLNGKDQQRIYRTASEDAIKYAKKYGEHPEVFFKQEYPSLYAQGVSMFGIKDGEKIAKQVAKAIYNVPDNEKPDVEKEMAKATKNMYAINRNKALMTKIQWWEKQQGILKPPVMGVIRGGVPYKPAGYDEQMKAYQNQRRNRIAKLGKTEADIKETALKYRMSESDVISMLEMMNEDKKGL
jgi:hypothetical protein